MINHERLLALKASILEYFHFDAQVITIIILRLWGVISGGISIILLPFYIGPVEQGYYYTFTSILALQVFFELGLGQVIIQFVAHEAAEVNMEAGLINMRGLAFERLNNLTRHLRTWYWIASSLFFIFVNFAGLWFFSATELNLLNWLLPWIFLCTATAYNLALGWRLSFLEGFGLVKEVGMLRLIQSVVGFILMWALMVADFQLWVVVAVPTTAAIFTSIWLVLSKNAKLLIDIENKKNVTLHTGIWRDEIFPFQWRIAVSWISGFFIFQLFTPIVFKHYGAIESGRVGLAISIFNSVTTVSIAWMSSKVPVIVIMLARNARREASQLFWKLTQTSLVFALMASCVIVLCAVFASSFSPHIRERLPGLSVLSALACTSVANCFILSCALFMRAHKEEPMMNQSVFMACIIPIALIFSIPYGLSVMMWTYCCLCFFVGVPWTLITLQKKYYLHA